MPSHAIESPATNFSSFFNGVDKQGSIQKETDTILQIMMRAGCKMERTLFRIVFFGETVNLTCATSDNDVLSENGLRVHMIHHILHIWCIKRLITHELPHLTAIQTKHPRLQFAPHGPLWPGIFMCAMKILSNINKSFATNIVTENLAKILQPLTWFYLIPTHQPSLAAAKVNPEVRTLIDFMFDYGSKKFQAVRRFVAPWWLWQYDDISGIINAHLRLELFISRKRFWCILQDSMLLGLIIQNTKCPWLRSRNSLHSSHLDPDE